MIYYLNISHTFFCFMFFLSFFRLVFYTLFDFLLFVFVLLFFFQINSVLHSVECTSRCINSAVRQAAIDKVLLFI